MKISLNEIKKLVKIPEGISDEELIRLIGARLVEVEEVDDWSEKFQGIKIVQVISCEPIPDTHLHLCQISCGSQPIQVVCGAPNVQADMLAVWIAPGCIVPATFGTDEPFKISSRKLRGYESSGMLAAADELGLGEDHGGIIEIDPEMEIGDGEKRRPVRPGDDFATAFGLCDKILDIENKSLTHRPDCFGLIGFAREVAGILGVHFDEQATLQSGESQEMVGQLTVSIEDAEICPRYSAAVIDFSDTPRSKYFTKEDVFLIKAGMRPISPIVDMTNRIMLMTGQPLHAFDYDKFIQVGNLDVPKIIIRTAKAGEKIELLDDRIIECDENDILITSNNIPVALAGAMGGKNTSIDEHTSHIILESATFSLYHLRKTQMKHGIFSEAITRFTKGQPAGQTLSVLEMAIAALGVEPQEIVDYYKNPVENPPIEVSVEDINSLLGTNYDEKLIIKTLENVGLTVERVGNARPHNTHLQLSVGIPYWRTDLHIKEDIIEEVGRLLGFDNIPLDFPVRPFVMAKEDPMLTLKNRIRDILSDRLNAHEVLTYSFVSKALQEKFGEDPKDSYEIVNSISPELQCFRQSIVPSLLEKVYENQKAGYKNFALYEINQVSKKSYGLTNEEVPVMKTNLALVVTGDYYQAKAYYVELLRQLGISGMDGNDQMSEIRTSQPVELAPSMLKKFKLEGPVSYFECTLDEILDLPLDHKTKTLRFSRFPSVSRDVTFKVKEDTPFADVYQSLDQSLKNTSLIYKLEPVSIYEPKENLEKTKNLSFHITLCSEDRTLNGEEISDIMGKITKKTCQAVGGELI